jgi:glycosyltransferase involved in cell wall biosynthesis
MLQAFWPELMKPLKKILFLSHEASLSGAPLVLLELMKWMKLHKQIEATLLLKEDGPLKEQFAAVSTVYFYNSVLKQFSNRLVASGYHRIVRPAAEARRRKELLKRLENEKFDLIYANTAGLGEVLNYLRPLRLKVVSHIHELEYVMQCSGKANIKATLDCTSCYIAVSEDVKKNLVTNHGVDPTSIKVFPPFVDFGKIDKGKDLDAASAIRKQLDIVPGGFIIGGGGSVEWRKGSDIFVQVAIQVLATIPNACFVWVGGERERYLLDKLNYDIKRAGLEKNVKFVGPNPNPYPYFQAFDIFMVTSREDPYPLVCIENIYLGKPVLCFDNAGGAAALVSSYNCGKSVPYLHVNSMAQAVTDYVQGSYNITPSVNTQKLKDEHAADNVSPKIFEAISDWSNE